jgi:hypothetical protein
LGCGISGFDEQGWFIKDFVLGIGNTKASSGFGRAVVAGPNPDSLKEGEL